MRFQVYQESRQGARPTNQDRIGYVYTNECLLMVVCDGMGGHYRGEIASQITVEVMARDFRRYAAPRLRDPAHFLASAILSSHQAIGQLAANNGLSETPRTTCVACVVQEGKVWWAHVGDSRLYMIRAGAMFRKTIDHSHVQTLLDCGSITQEEAAVHPDRNKIFNCLGQPTTPRIDVSQSTLLHEGDRLLLASDGLWGPLDPDFVAKSLATGDLSVATPMLMNLAEALSGRECDNLSGVSMCWMGLGGSPRDVQKSDFRAEAAIVRDDDLQMAAQMIGMACYARPTFRK